MRLAFKAARVHEWIERRYFLIIIVFLITGLLVPGLYAPFKNSVDLMLIIIMFTMALGCSAADLLNVMKAPGKMVLTIVLIYGVIPVISCLLGEIFFPGYPQIRAGLVLVAVLPVAITSAFWTSAAKGNLPLSLSVITLATLLSAFVTPGGMQLIVGQSITFDAVGLICKLGYTVIIPVVVGIIVREKARDAAQRMRLPLSLAAKVCIVMILGINGAVVMPFLDELGHLMGRIILVVFLQVGICYLIGYLFGRLVFPKEPGTHISLAFVSAMRNNAAGVMIALAYFPPAVALPVVLAIVIQQPLANAVTALFRSGNMRQQKRFGSKAQ